MLPTIWKLKPGSDRRIRSGHPWIFSNELEKSPKGHTPGAAVTLYDHKDQFVATGYGNPHSLIAFRALSFDQREIAYSEDFVCEKVIAAWKQRHYLGFTESFRLCYGEGDFLPGIVIDRFAVEQNGVRGQVFAIQVLTAGMNEILKDLLRFFEKLVSDAVKAGVSTFDWSKTAVMLRNDVNIRKLEGMTVEEPKLIKNIEGFNLNLIDIYIDKEFKIYADLISGQKTGFFLDQAYNIFLLCQLLEKMDLKGKTLRILDLCCYVGHWSTRISQVLAKKGAKAEVTAVDISKTALVIAKQNISREGANVITRELDVMGNLSELPEKNFDIVIADPPAFIKAKKDIPTGRHAYLKMNTAAFKFVKANGLVVSCSCSGLFEEEMLKEVIEKAIRRNELKARCILHGGHSADHPVLLGFTEGFYLKMFVHHVG